jgi:two-component system, sensor histidine kinase and response regulator
MSEVKRSSILVVDDTPANLLLLTRILSKQNYQVCPASSGEQALAAAKKELPDLILLDIMMPEMDGYEVCRRLKADEQTRDIPVIFISALDELFDEVAAFAVGGVDYITKPFQIEDVLARIQTHLSLKEMHQLLQTKNRLLQEQNRELDAFAHTVAHDLKSPLTKVIASLSLLKEYNSGLEEDSHQLVQICVGASHQMVSIINELLLLSSVRKETIQLAPIDMARTVDQAFSRLSPMIEEYRPEVTVPEQWPSAQGYVPWIEEVWANYLSNGLKYGGCPPYLELGATPGVDDQIRFWVRDNGPGLSPEAQARLFTEFTRLSQTRAEGHGLGLSIVRRIMNKLGGQCGVESILGHGSEFYFTLPMSST